MKKFFKNIFYLILDSYSEELFDFKYLDKKLFMKLTYIKYRNRIFPYILIFFLSISLLV